MMIHYLIQLFAYQLLFLLVYDLFLKKETFFIWNRVYLIVTSALSLVIPLIKIESFKEVVPQTYIWSFPKLNIDTQGPIILDEVILQGTTSNNVNPLWYLYAILILGGVLSLLYFLYRIYTISRLIKTHKMDKGTVYHVVEIPNSTTAFSFFNFVFLGTNIHETELGAIVDHEKVHVVQRHTWDLIFFELLRIPLWFNPLIYMYQSRMSDLHEFIADQQAVKQNKKQYYQNLLSQVFETQNVSFINTFFKKSLIKKRLVMLQKSKSSQVQLFKYALLIPVVLGMLIYSSCADDSNSVADNEMSLDQYAYTLKKGESLAGDKQVIHDRYEAFLRSHPDYVAWGVISVNEGQISYSVHHKNESIPEGFTKTEVSSTEGAYTLYMNFPSGETATSGDLLNKINAVKEQIEIEGNISEDGEKGIQLLFKMLTLDTSPNEKLIGEVQTYMNESNKDELHQRITDLFEAIQVKGDTTIEEDLALKTLLTLVSEEGLNGPFYEEIKDRIEIPFTILDKVPAFPNSGPFDSEEEKKKAFSQEISHFVAMNFNGNLASELGLTGEQKIAVFFKIGVDGNITEVKARAPRPELEAEAIRVVKMLPTFIPGEHQGKKVTVPYYLPIKFKS